MGPALYIARPLQIKNEACLRCHSVPDAAPKTMLDIYGRNNGFGWKHMEIVGAQVVCLPELFTGYYFCQKEDAALFDLAEPIPGPSEARLSAAAKANKVVVVGSLFERRMAGVYHNTATVHDTTGDLLGILR